MSTVEFCASCNNQVLPSDKFCTNCGASRPTQITPFSAGSSTSDAHFQSAPKPNAADVNFEKGTFIFEEPKKSRRALPSKKVIAMILAPILLLSAAGSGYWFITKRVDYNAKTISGLFLDSESRINRVIENSCPSFENVLLSESSEINAKTVGIRYDYTEALELDGNYRTLLTNSLNTWAANVLSAEIGSRTSKLRYSNLVKEDLITQVDQKCDSSVSVSELESDARDLDATIQKVNFPGSWEPSDYSQSDEDPNIAWKWAPDNSYSCSSYSDGCIRLYLLTNNKCSGSIDVRLGLMYTRGGTIQEYENGSLSDVIPGRVYALTVSHYGYEYGWWRIDTLTCSG